MDITLRRGSSEGTKEYPTQHSTMPQLIISQQVLTTLENSKNKKWGSILIAMYGTEDNSTWDLNKLTTEFTEVLQKRVSFAMGQKIDWRMNGVTKMSLLHIIAISQCPVISVSGYQVSFIKVAGDKVHVHEDIYLSSVAGNQEISARMTRDTILPRDPTSNEASVQLEVENQA